MACAGPAAHPPRGRRARRGLGPRGSGLLRVPGSRVPAGRPVRGGAGGARDSAAHPGRRRGSWSWGSGWRPARRSGSRSCSQACSRSSGRGASLRGETANRAAVGFALLTGVTIACYTSIDRVGVQLAPPWLFGAILWLVAAVGLLVVGMARSRVAGGRYAVTGPLDVPRSVASGLLTLVTYLLVLFALSRSPVAVVGPLRESAVLLTSATACSSCTRRSLAGRRACGWRAPRWWCWAPPCWRCPADATIGGDTQPVPDEDEPHARPDPRLQGVRRAVPAASACWTSRSPPSGAGFDSVWTSDHFQPWRHTDGHAPERARLAGRRRAGHDARDAGHERPDPVLPLQPGDRRAGVRDAGLPGAGPRDPRRRHRRVA